MSIESMVPSNRLILCCPLLLLPTIFPNIRVLSSELALGIRWPKYWSFSFSIIPSKKYPGLISFRMDWLDLLAVQGTLKSLLQHHSSKASILWCSAFFTAHLSHLVLFVSDSQRIGASASVLPMNIQAWYPLRLTGLISLQSMGLSRVFLTSQFKSINSSVLSLLYGPASISIHEYWKNHSFDYMDLCRQSLGECNSGSQCCWFWEIWAPIFWCDYLIWHIMNKHLNINFKHFHHWTQVYDSS